MLYWYMKYESASCICGIHTPGRDARSHSVLFITENPEKNPVKTAEDQNFKFSFSQWLKLKSCTTNIPEGAPALCIACDSLLWKQRSTTWMLFYKVL